ncbi:Uncharacterised protein [Achromobacter xylosoxidans]|uniref:hypothetical protein n=1 Tax=Alcaligenes xylosoxydans xylosoxydans TaxID=85698 RepID=UPI0006C0B7DC|nr:hypothetical protein [Achromobacter xylosoxidans]CUJ58854.1 Uncharacterised protein [Achromobacter xylosoxidans]
MTTQNNAAQAAKPQTVLSFNERERILCQFIREPINHDREMAIAIESAVLSKLRAPVADERISLLGAANLAFNALHECKPAKGAEKQYSDAIQALQSALHDIAYTVNRTATPQQFADHLQQEARAALASASVADESPMAKMADALREKARQEQQAYQDSRVQSTEWGPMPHGTEADLPASAPVAREVLGWRVRERRSNDGKLLDCFVEAPAVPGMAYAQEVLGDDYAEAQGGIEGKLKHCQMIVAWANAAPQASAENDREGLAHKVNLLTAELLGHRSAAGHLSVLVDELRGHLIDARQVMADFQQAFVPAFDTPETLTMVPNEALVPFCAALDRLRGLDLPQAAKDGGQQRAGDEKEPQ